MDGIFSDSVATASLLIDCTSGCFASISILEQLAIFPREEKQTCLLKGFHLTIKRIKISPRAQNSLLSPPPCRWWSLSSSSVPSSSCGLSPLLLFLSWVYVFTKWKVGNGLIQLSLTPLPYTTSRKPGYGVLWKRQGTQGMFSTP